MRERFGFEQRFAEIHRRVGLGARGAGLDGMAAMEAHWHHAGLRWHRPLLTAPRQLLRDYLNERGAIWVEDPSNESDDFERVRIRRALPMLAPLGLSIDRLAEVALHLREAKIALDQVTDTAFATFSFDRGTVCFAVDCLGLHPPDIQRRLLQKVLMWISPSDYGPRGPALQRLRHSVLAQHDATLAGCRFLVNGGAVRALRELNAVGPCVAQGEIWDGRWQITGPTLEGAVIGPLGVLGLAQVPNWRSAALPRAALLSSPALWLGTRLIAAPFAHFGHEWAAIAALQSQRSNSITLTH
jgi:tRNA(Ile)-lysidine synthase